MRIIVDTREPLATAWTFEHDPSARIVRKKLDAGDYSVEGLESRVAIERKSLDDWTGTVLRDRARFQRELELLRAYDFRCVIIEGSVRNIMERAYESAVAPSSVLGFVAEVSVAQSVPVYLGGTRAECQLLALAFLRMAAKKMQATG